jgi:transcriptional repressor NrdR
VRFASVYRKFQDIEEFREEIARLERDMPGLAAEQLPLLDDPKKP